MSRVAFKQDDMARVLKAASKVPGAAAQVDMKTLIVTIVFNGREKLVDGEGNPLGILPSGNFAPDGKENWDED